MKLSLRNKYVGLVLCVMSIVMMTSVVTANSVSFWLQEASSPVMIELIKEFTEETGIEVDMLGIGYDLDHVVVAMAAGSPPDLFTHGAAALGAFGASGQLFDVTRHMSEWDFIDDMVMEARSAGVYQGAQIAVPWRGVTVRDLAYRVDFFEESGLGGPPVTWGDLMETGRKVVRTNNDGELIRSGISLAASGNGAQQVFSMFHAQSGGGIIVDGQSGLADASAVEALEFYVELVNDSGFFGSGGVLAGTAAMQWSSFVTAREAQDVDTAEYVFMATFPYSLQPTTFSAADWMAIPAGAANRDNALKLMAFLARPESQNRISYYYGSVPYYTQAVDWDWVRENPQILHLMSALSYGQGNPPHELWFDIRGVLVDAVDRALRREQPAQNLLGEAHRLVNQLIAGQ